MNRRAASRPAAAAESGSEDSDLSYSPPAARLSAHSAGTVRTSGRLKRQRALPDSRQAPVDEADAPPPEVDEEADAPPPEEPTDPERHRHDTTVHLCTVCNTRTHKYHDCSNPECPGSSGRKSVVVLCACGERVPPTKLLQHRTQHCRHETKLLYVLEDGGWYGGRQPWTAMQRSRNDSPDNALVVGDKMSDITSMESKFKARFQYERSIKRKGKRPVCWIDLSGHGDGRHVTYEPENSQEERQVRIVDFIRTFMPYTTKGIMLSTCRGMEHADEFAEYITPGKCVVGFTVNMDWDVSELAVFSFFQMTETGIKLTPEQAVIAVNAMLGHLPEKKKVVLQIRTCPRA